MRRGIVGAGIALAVASAYGEPLPLLYSPVYFADLHTGRFVARDRPSRCPSEMQPAIVDFEGNEHIPVWSCVAACKPGFEPVTHWTSVGESYLPGSLSAQCQAVCPPDRHRADYFVYGLAAQDSCHSGAPSSEYLYELASIRSSYDARKKSDYDAIDSKISALRQQLSPDGVNDVDVAIRAFDEKWQEPETTARLRAAFEATWR